MTEQNGERLQKALSRAGIASRRGGEELILAGRVKVNGKIVTELGTKINPAVDKVSVDDEPVAVRVDAAPQKVYIMLNKPAGYLSTVSDPQGRPTIMDLLDTDRYGRLYPVGRLDADTEGLLLLTNDGAFANALSHPRFGVEKEYVALVDGIIAMKDIDQLRRGVSISVEDTETGEHISHLTKPAKVDLIRHEGSNSLVRFILKEGKKRQIRLMADAVDHPVIELRRVRQGPVKLSDLASGKFRNLSKQEVKDLQDASKPGAAPEEVPTPTPTPRRSPATGPTSGRSNFAPRDGGFSGGRPSFGSRDSGPGDRRPNFSSRDSGPSERRSGFGARDSGPNDRRPSFGTRDNNQGTGRSDFAPRDGGPGTGRGRPERPAAGPGRVEPFKAPGGSRGAPRRFGPGRFEDEGDGNRRGPSPNRGPRPGPARFDREEGDRNSASRPVPPRFQRDGGRSSTPDRGPRPGPGRFEREDGERGSGAGRGPRPAGRFERDENSAPRRDFGGSDRPERGNERRPERSSGYSDRPTGPRRNTRPEGDGEGEERRPFRSGGPRQGGGFGRDRDNGAPSAPRGGPGGGRKFLPPGGGSPSFPSRYSRPNPNGFVPAADRSAPTPGRGRPPGNFKPGGSRPGGPGGASRGGPSGPRTGSFRPDGPRPGGPNRSRRPSDDE